MEDDGAAADEILERAGPELAKAVFRTANCLLANHSDAEEVTLEVLVALDAKTLELGKGALETWLEGLPHWLDETTINKSKPRAQKRRRHAKRLDELALLADSLQPELSAGQRRARLVREVLSYLPRRHRFVYILAVGLGHDDASVAERLGAEPSAVARSRKAVAGRLEEFATHTLEQRGLLEAMATPGPDNPLHDYVREFGALDEATRTRTLRRLAATMSHGPASMEMSGDSLFDAQMSGFHYPMAAAAESTSTSTPAIASEVDPPIDPSTLYQRQRHWPVVMFGSVTLVLLLASLMIVSQTRTQIVDLSDRLDALSKRNSAAEQADGPELLEPGKFAELSYDGRAEPSKDAQVELLRSDAKGAELRLSAGSVSLHVNEADGVAWIVHDGRYDIRSPGKRFRVTHTGDVPKVEVFQGQVRVSGGLLGGEGVVVKSSDRTLAAVMATREAPLAEMPIDEDQRPAELELDELYARALKLRETEPKEAEDLLRDIEIRGGDSWICERALDQLRTLVAPEERGELADNYLSRFPEGAYRQAFAAMRCQTLELDDEVETCWTEFRAAFPHSLYGP